MMETFTMTPDVLAGFISDEITRDWSDDARLVKVTEHPLSATVEVNGILREIVVVPSDDRDDEGMLYGAFVAEILADFWERPEQTTGNLHVPKEILA